MNAGRQFNRKIISRRTGRATKEQVETLVSYMQTHPKFAEAKFLGKNGRYRLQKQWDVVAGILNRIQDGITKNAKQWQIVWRDLKFKAAVKAGNLKEGANSGDSSGKSSQLTSVERRILAIRGYKEVNGDNEEEEDDDNVEEEKLQVQLDRIEMYVDSNYTEPRVEVQVDPVHNDPHCVSFDYDPINTEDDAASVAGPSAALRGHKPTTFMTQERLARIQQARKDRIAKHLMSRKECSAFRMQCKCMEKINDTLLLQTEISTQLTEIALRQAEHDRRQEKSLAEIANILRQMSGNVAQAAGTLTHK